MMRSPAALLLVTFSLAAAQSPPPTPGNATVGKVPPVGAESADAAGSKSASNPAPVPVFDAVDVHASPHTSFQFMQGGHLVGNVFVMREATMPQLIAAAYDFDSKVVVGGPTWLDLDRFDVMAVAPPNTSPASLKLMVRAMLKDRFSLAVHESAAPVPAYILKVAGAQPKLKETEGSGDPGCQFVRSDSGDNSGIPPMHFHCVNQTMAQFARFLQNMQGGGYLSVSNPVVDSTALTAAYDFDITWTHQQNLAKAGPDGVTIFDALEQQLGLRLILDKAPRPALIVDSVNETPSPNPPGVEKLLPAPPTQFEVATIKPSKPDTRGNGSVRSGLVDLHGISLKDLIEIAWDINPMDKEALIGAPDWLEKDKYDITAKVSADDPGSGSARAPDPDFVVLSQMLQNLLIERFQMKIHRETRDVTAYTLVVAGPKIKPAADPAARMKCTEGPGPDGKDPRTVNPTLNRLLWCQNITMPVFAQQLQYLANGYIYYPVTDATGLQGGYDFLLNFASIGNLLSGGGGGGGGDSPNAPNTASDPNGAVSLFDAIRKQLGLKLEKTKRPEQVLVIDHMEEKPTEN